MTHNIGAIHFADIDLLHTFSWHDEPLSLRPRLGVAANTGGAENCKQCWQHDPTQRHAAPLVEGSSGSERGHSKLWYNERGYVALTSI